MYVRNIKHMCLLQIIFSPRVRTSKFIPSLSAQNNIRTICILHNLCKKKNVVGGNYDTVSGMYTVASIRVHYVPLCAQLFF